MENYAWLDAIRGTAFAGILSQIATAFLVWKGRQEIAAMPEFDAREKRSGFDCTPPECATFLDELTREHRGWTREDSEAAFQLIAKNCKSLSSWIGALVELAGITLLYDTNDPYVSVKDTLSWSALAEWIDPDTVLTFLLAAHTAAASDLALVSAAPVTRISDRNLNVILDKGITDYHVHMGGMRSAQELWRALLSNDQDPARLRRYAGIAAGSLVSPEQALQNAELRGIQELAKRLALGRSPLGVYWQADRRRRRNERERIASELVRERRAITAAWRNLREAARTAVPLTIEQRKLELELGHYIFLKGAFLRWHRQPENTNPGLAEFRRFYRSTDPNLPKHRPGNVRFERSPRILMRGYSEFAAYILQSPSLKRIELRIPPLPSPRDYHRFLSMWREVERAFGLSDTGVEIGFAVHFKRSLEKDDSGKRKKRSSGEDKKKKRKARITQLRKFLSSLDRESAILHQYRSRRIENGHAHRILRLDLAGAERDMPPAIASFCMNLARGNVIALERLEHGNLDRETHKLWLWHLKCGTHRQPPAMPTLGQTCHAGEDYAHPLEGLYCVASAVERLQMREGDTIGHGLALAQDIASFEAVRGVRAMTTRGHQFDSLLWLYNSLRKPQFEMRFAAHLNGLSDWLLMELRRLYPDECQSVWNLQVLSDIDALRCGIELAKLPPLSSVGTLAERLVQCEIKDVDCAGRREERVPIAPIVFGLSPAIIELQEHWLRAIAERGIVLEFNPSSNLRVSGSGSVPETPFMKIFEIMRDRILATINTDNPGVFATRIENEFALVFKALQDSGFSRADAQAVTERLRNVGLDLVYWPFTQPEKNEPARERGIFR